MTKKTEKELSQEQIDKLLLLSDLSIFYENDFPEIDDSDIKDAGPVQ